MRRAPSAFEVLQGYLLVNVYVIFGESKHANGQIYAVLPAHSSRPFYSKAAGSQLAAMFGRALLTPKAWSLSHPSSPPSITTGAFPCASC